MKPLSILLTLLLSIACTHAGPANQLTEKEKTGGWILLFDGRTTDGWRGYKLEDVPPGWTAKDGVLSLTPANGTTDLITKEQYGDFELVVEWQIGEGGNSGILFRANEENDKIWHSAVEIQVLDNDRHKNKKKKTVSTVSPDHAAGAVYALYPAKKESFREHGAWNETRIVAKGTKVTVYQNGTEIATYDTSSDEFKKKVAESKFKKYAGFATLRKGHIALQAHGDAVKYRNIKLRKLKG